VQVGKQLATSKPVTKLASEQAGQLSSKQSCKQEIKQASIVPNSKQSSKLTIILAEK
jgi:hypothetical protein